MEPESSKRVIPAPIGLRCQISKQFVESFINFILTLNNRWFEKNNLPLNSNHAQSTILSKDIQLQLLHDPLELLDNPKFLESLNERQKWQFKKLLQRYAVDIFEVLRIKFVDCFELNRM